MTGHYREALVTFIRVGHREVYSLKQRTYREQLAMAYYEREKKTPSTSSITDTLNVLSGHALHSGGVRPVWIRLAGLEDRIYLDLANDCWEVVEVTRDGWQVLPQSPVYFRRSQGMEALPHPKAGGDISILRSFVNIEPDDFVLLVSWLLGALRPSGPYPILVLQGEQGSAKSTTSRVLRALLDPNGAPSRSHPREERDLMIAARNGWILNYDNLSRLPPPLADGLCRIATGGGFAKRENYTDTDEVLIQAQRPIILNGIDELVTRGDLMDRALILALPRLKATDRLTERDIWQAFEKERPQLLGVLLDAVAHGLRQQDQVSLQRLPRMADFATWCAATLPAMGWSLNDFMAAYSRNRNAGTESILDASPLAAAVRVLAGKGHVGTASELMKAAERVTSDSERRHYGWPKSAASLSGALRRLAPALRTVGVHIVMSREGKEGRRVIRLSLLAPGDDAD